MDKIKKLETFTNEYVGFVKATSESGLTGWGQVSTYNADITCTIFHRQIAPHALGTDALDFEDTLNLIGEREHKYPGSYLRRAMTGLDTALWDLKGKREEKPVVSLIGGKPGKLRAYASSMKRDITPEDEAKRFLSLRDDYGFDAFKWRVGRECGRDQDEWPGRTLAAVRKHPMLLGGTDRFDTVLIEETEGAVISKVGAEGVHTLMVPAIGMGIALKAEDGAQRAQHCAVVHILQQLGVLQGALPKRLADWLVRPIKNTRGEIVGEVRPAE